jgi:4-hydroxyphenylpyruvate dioxygenase-like putative hemolysin
MTSLTDRELTADAANPVEIDGIEFIEYATSRPQSLGQVLEMMASARSRGTARARCCSTGRAR